MQTTILSHHLDTEGVDFDRLASELGVPVLAGLQHQGDVSVIPADMVDDYRTPAQPLPQRGLAVVRGESGGNTHLLLASGTVYYKPQTSGPSDLTLASLLVPEGATAYLDHPEHGNSGIAPGAYVVRRKRTQRELIELVKD